MSTTSAPESVEVPARPATRRSLGNLRSLVISLVVVMAAVVAWVAMVPRPREISQPAVDVTSVARQVRREAGWAISQPQLPPGWKATSVRFRASADGVKTWHAGYLSPDGHYVSIDQAQVGAASGSWVSELTSNGQAQGTLSAAGVTWRKLSSRTIVQRSLLSTGSLSQGSVRRGTGDSELTTLVSGTASYLQLAQFARDLKPVPKT